jgi:hypothetical protein
VELLSRLTGMQVHATATSHQAAENKEIPMMSVWMRPRRRPWARIDMSFVGARGR